MHCRQISNLTVAALVLAGCAPEQSPAEPTGSARTAAANEQSVIDLVSIGRIDRLYSESLGEEREVWIHLPYDDVEETYGQNYPVVYLLDGRGHFHSVSGMIHQLSSVNGNHVSPQMIVVGIPNTNRMRDLTPTNAEEGTGGGPAFLDFIENEVIPYIESNYPASNYRTFIGHSLGGLMVIDTLLERPDLFTNYIAIDPSMWWDDRKILAKAEGSLHDQDLTGKTLYVSVANTMRDGITIDVVREDDNPQTNHIRSILRFTEVANASTVSNSLDFAWRYYQDDSHGSVPLISEYDALRYLFPWYNPNTNFSSFHNPELPDDPDAGLAVIDEHFSVVSELFGYEVKPLLGWVLQQANGFRSGGKLETALALLELNLENYPDVARVHEAMGEYFLLIGDKTSAWEHFEHAVGLGAEIDVRDKLASAKAD